MVGWPPFATPSTEESVGPYLCCEGHEGRITELAESLILYKWRGVENALHKELELEDLPTGWNVSFNPDTETKECRYQ